MLTILDPNNEKQNFPPVERALTEPNGLIAVGGSLTVGRLERAYRQGIFPWYSEGDPILWWSPDPRLVLLPENLRVSKSLRKVLRRQVFQFSFDQAFETVISACAEPRKASEGTWLTPEMRLAYVDFHRAGFAHSFEAWQQGVLVGGLYGVALGQVFFGESMFYRVTDASKAAFAFAVDCLSNWGYRMIDCQVHTPHLAGLGAELIERARFQAWISEYSRKPISVEAWQSTPAGRV